jgi:hypothetical protein
MMEESNRCNAREDTGVVHSKKLGTIQLVEADLYQVLHISDHYDRANATCMTPILNKLFTIQLMIQKSTEGIIFDNNAKGCYNRIISRLALVSLRRLGYPKESVNILRLLWSQMEHYVMSFICASVINRDITKVMGQ